VRALLGCAVLGLSLFAGTACGSSAPSCADAGKPLLDSIAAGAKGHAVQMGSGKTLKMADRDNVYLVAAKVRIAGGAERVGVWTTSNLGGEGEILNVDAAAKTATSYGDSATGAAKVAAGDEAVGKVKACL
jgi:hypothetical protein